MAADGTNASELDPVWQLPDPAICRAEPARWPDMVSCLVHDPQSCKYARYFNENAYCTHPDRQAIIDQTKAGKT